MNNRLSTFISILATLKNPFDYKEYIARCKEEGGYEYDEMGFIQRMYWFQNSKMRYADLEPTEAYLKYLAYKDNNFTEPAAWSKVTIDAGTNTKCGGCGGSNRNAGGKLR